MKRIHAFLVAILGVAAAIGGAGCTSKDGEGPAEQAGKAIDDTVEKVDDKLQDIADDTKKTVKDAAEDVKEDVKKTVEE